MIKGTKGYERVLVDVALAIPAFCIALFAYWLAMNLLYPSTYSSAPRSDRYEYAPGEIAEFQTTVRRYSDCKLDISRILERIRDKQEISIQFMSIVIQADHPVFDRPNGFRVQIPPETIAGEYDLFSRIRYFCNGLDYLWPRYMSTNRARLVISELHKGAL